MKNLFNFKQTGKLMLAALCIGTTLFSCKEKNIIGASPYSKGPEPLVHFKDARPEPQDGKVGAEVTYGITGLKDLKDFTFYINQTEAKVVKVSDTTVTVKVPEEASSGAASIIVNGQTYFGPIFNVDGKVSIAPSFDAFNGANREIKQILERPADGTFMLVGNFTDYENNAQLTNNEDAKYINHIVQISGTGEFLDRLISGKGANGSLNTIARNGTDGSFFVGGTFGTYNIRGGITNVTHLNSNASLDTMTVDLINLDPENTPNAGKDTVPRFNGGVSGGLYPNVLALFFDQPSNMLYVVGNYNRYQNIYYPRSTKSGSVVNETSMAQLIRVFPDGSLDSTFNYDESTGKSLVGGNGFIIDAFRTPDGKIVIVGNFTNFDGKTVNRIARINDVDGRIDEAFATGSGADGPISKVTYNAATKKFLITGSFDHFNGIAANGVVMLNADGSVDTQFNFGKTTQGRANYAGQLDNGLILVSGRFLKYEGVVRSGFMILNPDGTLAEGYNNTGAFIGYINQIVESKTSLNDPGVILVGSFSRFDNQSVGNIVKIALKP